MAGRPSRKRRASLKAAKKYQRTKRGLEVIRKYRASERFKKMRRRYLRLWSKHLFKSEERRAKEALDNFKKQLRYPWQRLFAIEYTDYGSVELQEFLARPDKYQAKGPKGE
jgi:hypothetical protein